MVDEQQGDLILELLDVTVYYGNVLALGHVNMTVRRGNLVSLLGGNASGKTTTMKTILGVVRPSSGSIRIAGEPSSHSKTSEIIRRGVAMVPENRELFPRMTVEENLRLGAYVRRSEKEENEATLAWVFELFPRVKERRTQAAGTLSGGEQQMVAMGRALMSRPSLILMDEPSMGLSPGLVKHSFELIDQIHSQGMSMLVVEQNATSALAIADYGYVLQAGEIVLDGPAGDLAQDPDLKRAYLS